MRMNLMCIKNTRRVTMLAFIVFFSFVCSSVVNASVSYDDKAFIINGKRRLLISGSIHYPRSTPEMWPGLIQMAKDGGLDVIQTYVFWNMHEPAEGKYDFGGRSDLVRFIKLVQQAGLYVHLRIGPYVCAEWNYGGFPVWLKYVPGIEFRTDNEPFKVKMQGFVEKIVNMMKYEKLFEPQGGPIIMSQIENEYGPVEWEIGAPGKAYTNWAASMANGLNTGVPWVMCKQDDVPDHIIDSCNGFYCENFQPKKPNIPKMFTELWTGWYTPFGGPIPRRPAEDIAFSVARFVQNNGSFFNYYMFHGGTNFGRTGSGLFVATSYEYDAPIDEYGEHKLGKTIIITDVPGLPNEPKYTHLTNLHKAIKLCEQILVTSYPTITWPGKNQEVHVFRPKSGGCAAFLSNLDPNFPTKITFENMQYDLPPWSISILPDCKTVAFNTANGSAKRSNIVFTPVGVGLTWQSYIEPIPSTSDNDTFVKDGMWEQVFLTGDTSDYLWYMTEINIAPGEEFLKNGKDPLLTVMSAGHVLHVYVNGQLLGQPIYGELENTRLTFNGNVKLIAGINKISLCSATVGLPNVKTHFEKWNAGVLGPVTLSGLNEGKRDLSKQKWTYKVGLKGESLHFETEAGSSASEWGKGPSLAKKQPFTWYKTTFDAPAGNEPLALDMNAMGKGQIWINGQSIGRHWPGVIAKGNCGQCNYAEAYTEKKCLNNCGKPSQAWYHVPRSWLKPSRNLLAVFEEWGGNPLQINLVRRTV